MMDGSVFVAEIAFPSMEIEICDDTRKCHKYFGILLPLALISCNRFIFGACGVTGNALRKYMKSVSSLPQLWVK